MFLISDKSINLILAAIFFLSLYFDSKFNGLLVIALWALILGILESLKLFDDHYKSLIFIFTLIPVSLYSLLEAQKFKRLGKQFYITKRSKLLLIVLLGLYLLAKLFITGKQI